MRHFALVIIDILIDPRDLPNRLRTLDSRNKDHAAVRIQNPGMDAKA